MNPPLLFHQDGLYMRHPDVSDGPYFVRRIKDARGFHHPWSNPTSDPDQFKQYATTINSGERHRGFFICTADHRPVGVINIREIVRGALQGGFLGYYLLHPDDARKGYMLKGLRMVLHYAFNTMGLHRLEANIQPENTASIALVKRSLFVKEGFSKNYLYMASEWRDHERWAITGELWKPSEAIRTHG